jgi:hypothetical protein
MRRCHVSTLLIALATTGMVARSQTAARSETFTNRSQTVLKLTITDSETRHRVPARVRLRDESGQDHVPGGAVEVPIGRDRWFVADGSVKLPIPAGQINLRVERGPEYRPILETLDLAPEKVTRHRVTLKRWINLRKLGYASGENHLHVPPEQLGAMLAAEDLDFGTSLSWWNGPAFNVGAGGRFRTLSFGKHRIPATVFDAEVEHQWGAVYLVGLKTPMSLDSDSKRPNLPFVQFARDQGALICYQGGWSREVLLDALLGYVDVVNVCNNNFHRHKFQPRRQYSNLLNLAGFPEYPDTPEGMMRMNTDTYYRLLNCGLRLAAGAGSATGAKTTPVGYNRCYARVGRHGTISDFLESWRQGRNFVTDGPMIFLTVNDSHMPGDVIALPAEGGKLHATARVFSDQPLRSLEIVVNGTVASHADLPAAASEAQLNVNLDLHKGCWIAARATAEDRLLSDEEMMRYDNAGEGSRRQKPCRLLFGHTSPVYVTVGGADASVKTSVREAFQMLDGFERFATANAAEKYRDELREALRLARLKLETLSRGW